jgi:hypothetical protein
MTTSVLDTNNRQSSLRVNVDGELLVAGVSGGGGGGGDASAANQTTQIAQGATLIAQTDGIEASLSAIDAKLSTENTNSAAAAGSLSVLDDWDESDRAKVNLVAGQAGVDGGGGAATSKTLRVILSTDSPGGSGGGGTSLTPVASASASYTRPANTTTYAAGMVIADSTSAATALTFTGMASAAGKGGILLSAMLYDSANQTLKLDAELFLFTASPTMQNDGVAWAPTDSDVGNIVARVRFNAGLSVVGNTAAGASGNVIIDSEAINRAYVSGASTSLFGVLVVRNGYTPVSAEVLTIRLLFSQGG